MVDGGSVNLRSQSLCHLQLHLRIKIAYAIEEMVEYRTYELRVLAGRFACNTVLAALNHILLYAAQLVISDTISLETLNLCEEGCGGSELSTVLAGYITHDAFRSLAE